MMLYKGMIQRTLLKAISYSGLYSVFYSRKRLKSYFLHRVISHDHPYYDYHTNLDQLSVSDFERRLIFVMKNNRFISLEEYSDIVVNNKPVKENMVLLTFDDGYRCLYRNAFPILIKYQVPAVVFVTANCVENQIAPPHDRLLYTLINSIGKNLNIHFEGFSYVTTLIDRQKVCNAYITLSRYLKSVPDTTRLTFQNYLMGILSVNENAVQLADEMLTWDQLKEMSNSGLMAIGAHTMNHPILSKLTLKTMRSEIVDSRELIEKRLGIHVASFAYPNGRLNDLNMQALDIVSTCFSLAFCTLGRRSWQEDRFLITRHGFDITPEYFLPLVDSGLIDPFATYRLTPLEREAYLKDKHHITIPERMYS